MICPKCGTNIHEDYRYVTCPNCGKTYDTQDSRVNKGSTTAPKTNPKPQPKPEPKVDTIVEPKTAPKPEPKIDTIVETETYTKPEPESKLKVNANIASKPTETPKAEPNHVPESDSKPASSTSSNSATAIGPSSFSNHQKSIFIALGVFVLVLGGVLLFLYLNGNFSPGYVSNDSYSDSSYDSDYDSSYDDSDSYYDETTTTTTSTTTETTTEEPDGEYYRVTVGYNNRLNLREQPNENSESLGLIDNGTSLYITEIRGNWGKTTYGGDEGWVCISMYGDTYCTKE